MMNDMEQDKITAKEAEDDQRCADCGSTEAGNCFYCKAD
jgi:hypothetical protein